MSTDWADVFGEAFHVDIVCTSATHPRKKVRVTRLWRHPFGGWEVSAASTVEKPRPEPVSYEAGGVTFSTSTPDGPRAPVAEYEITPHAGRADSVQQVPGPIVVERRYVLRCDLCAFTLTRRAHHGRTDLVAAALDRARDDAIEANATARRVEVDLADLAATVGLLGRE